MKCLNIALCLVFLIGGVLNASPQRSRVRSDQEILIELERGWNDAFYRRDVDFIDNILAEEFIATYDDGRRGDRDTELGLVLAFDQQVESATQDEFIVRVYENTAVVWFTLNLVGIRDGERAEVSFRFTDVFVWRDDRWQCVSSQSTRVNSA